MPKAVIADWRLYVITDYRLARGRPQDEIIRAVIEGGADVVQFREKELAGPRLLDAAKSAARTCRRAGVPLIVNDNLTLALAVEADGLHVGQQDLSASMVRQRLGPGRILGVSARTPDEAQRAIRDGADYLGVGPVHEARKTKPDASVPIGLEGLAAVCEVSTVPVIAIGGIRADNAGDIIRAGAQGVAVISAVVSADDVRLATAEMKEAIRPAGLGARGGK